MDFGMQAFENTILDNDEKTINNNNNPKAHGSGFLKHQRSDPDNEEPFLRSYKAARPDSFDAPDKTMSMRSDSLLSVPPCSSGSSNNMLSFSSIDTAKNGNQSSLLSFYQPPPAYLGNAVSGYGYGGMQSRYKGPFTPSQWMELEHQALIYKHIVANVPVPSHLLNPLIKSLNPFLFSRTPSTSYALNSYGWGSFHLGLSGNNDPEPGRCRRTDGKKWRCSRDAVPDQKYCERHINRGRHRSRKPVEGQNGHKSNPPTTTTTATAAAATPPKAAPVNNQIKKPHPHNATLVNRSQDSQAFSVNAIEESSGSLLSPLHHFIDSWPKDQLDRTSIAWPEEPKPDWTQLTMSIAPLGQTQDFDFDLDRKQASNFIPISWENSMGGPLGEVLKRTGTSKNGSSVSEMNHLFEIDGNDRVGYSPTGVLQKTTFVSLSNSSSGSSPRGNKRGGDSRSFCDEMLVSSLAGSTL